MWNQNGGAAALSDPWGASSGRGLHGHLVEQLGLGIARGDLAAGEQVIPDDLAAQFGVSRTVVREALRVLETKGMIAARQRTGTRVRERVEWDALDSDVIRWRAAGREARAQLEELLDIRGAIEPLAARKASANPNLRFESFEATLQEMSRALDTQDWAAFTEADVAFHRALLEASASLVIGRFAEPIEAAIRVRSGLRLIPDHLSADAIESHRAIVDAIRAQDGVAAELASRRIVDVAGAETIDSLMRRSGAE